MNSKKCLFILAGIFCILSVFALFFGEKMYYTLRIFFGSGDKVGAIPSALGVACVAVLGCALIFGNDNIEYKGIITIVAMLTVCLILIILAMPFYRIFNSYVGSDLIVTDGYKICIICVLISLVLSVIAGFAFD